MSKGRVLLVDDDPLLVDAVTFSLRRAGYEVSSAGNAEDAVVEARQHPPDLAILDIGLPGRDGLALCRTLQTYHPLPVIFLTARDREMDVILGLEHGADDYITKPFSMGELTARVAAVMRRTTAGRTEGRPLLEEVKVRDVSVNLITRKVAIGKRTLELPPKEFDLLALLIRHAGQVLSRQNILDQVWGEDYFGDTRVLDVHIRWLRELIEPEPSRPRYVLTVRGVGYKFTDEEDGRVS